MMTMTEGRTRGVTDMDGRCALALALALPFIPGIERGSTCSPPPPSRLPTLLRRRAAAFAAVAADVVFYFVFKCGTRGCAIIARGQLSEDRRAALRCCEMSASGSALALTIVLYAVFQEG